MFKMTNIFYPKVFTRLNTFLCFLLNMVNKNRNKVM